MLQRPGIGFALACCCLLLGCGRVERTRECREVIRTVNDGLTEIGALADAQPPDPKNLAERYTQLAARLRQLQVGNQSLSKNVEDYATLCEDTALALDTSRPMPHRADGRLRPRPSLAHIPRRERTLVARLNSVCVSP
ncbi:MAG: hypothetical protein R3B13_02235 [Polyangiaceae bacterium]